MANASAHAFPFIRIFPAALALLAASALLAQMSMAAELMPQPGAVYREYYAKSPSWRVSCREEEHIAEHPNATYHIDIRDLEGAIRAEGLVVRWGGHPGTSRRRIAFGYTNDQYGEVGADRWVDIPELETMPVGHLPQSYMHMDNPTFEIPLDRLAQGPRPFILDCGPQVSHDFEWGQWGFYGLVVRVYYDPAAKPHPTGRISSPVPGGVLSEDPLIEVAVEGEAAEVQVLGLYYGLDEDGDGYFSDWHRWYFAARDSSDAPAISGHVGTVEAAPWALRWDTRFVPNQSGIKLIARIRGADGMWFVTEPVEGLSLPRGGRMVALLKPRNVPEKFWRPWGEGACRFVVPDEVEPSRIIDARIHWRTWAEKPGEWSLNGARGSTGGGDHEYAFEDFPVAPEALTPGSHELTVTLESEHHGVEVLWPGPMITVEYEKPETPAEAP